MSVIFVVAPVIVGSWPVISAAIIAGAGALGYHAATQLEQSEEANGSAGYYAATRSVDMQMDDSRVVADSMRRGESFTVTNGAIEAKFRIDGRGQCQVHLSGLGKSDMELEAAGRELMDRVRQQFAYSQVMAELESRGFEIAHQQVEADQSIRITVRR